MDGTASHIVATVTQDKSGADLNQIISFWFAMVATTIFLIWGFRLLSKELQRPTPEGRTLLMQALSEKTEPTGNSGTKPKEVGSFSRTAGAIGALSIAATF